MLMGTKSQRRTVPARHPMRRTTSMTEFAPPDVLADVAEEADEETELQVLEEATEEVAYGWVGGAAAKRADWLAAYRARAAPALVGHRRNSADFSAVETAAFLRACGLCNRRLGPGRDTFMYRGDTAFCSLECREQHITHEEWKDKCGARDLEADAGHGGHGGAGKRQLRQAHRRSNARRRLSPETTMG